MALLAIIYTLSQVGFGIVVAGVILMFSARFILRSTFFQIAQESEG